jgi:hypothetical protein
MVRLLVILLAFGVAAGAPETLAQAKKAPAPAAAAPGRVPTNSDKSVAVTLFMRDAAKNELLLATRVWPDYPDYNAAALGRFFAMMKSLEPGYVLDDEVAYTWSQKGRVTKCSIYLESADAATKTGTGAVVGCEANGVSTLAVPSGADSKRSSGSQEPKHLADVLDLFRKQAERAKASLAKK